VSFDPEIDFPVTMTKAHIMQAVDRAMAIKIFDDFGCLPGHHKKRDPIIVGRLRDPRPASWTNPQRWISFILAWHLDTDMI
jgi:hypothetical protein